MSEQLEDPELDAEDAIVAKYGHMGQAMLDDAVRYGYRAALRSLNAGTPEAEAALRRMVKAVLSGVAAAAAYQANGEHGEELRQATRRTLVDQYDAERAFAALATSTKKLEMSNG